jgi:hypothetical protein
MPQGYVRSLTLKSGLAMKHDAQARLATSAHILELIIATRLRTHPEFIR